MAQSGKDKLIFADLVQTFKQFFPCYGDEVDLAYPSLSFVFAKKVLFEYGNEVKRLRNYDKTHVWKHQYKLGNKKYSIYVHYKNFYGPPAIQGNRLRISFKLASLLAVHKFCSAVPLLVARNEIILTPLAGAVFHRDILPNLLIDLQKYQQTPLKMPDLIIDIISSCQTDGFYLPASKCAIALVAIVCSVRDTKLRDTILKSTTKSYMKMGKYVDIDKFYIYLRHANQHADIERILSDLNGKFSREKEIEHLNTELTSSDESSSSSSSSSSSTSESNSDSEGESEDRKSSISSTHKSDKRAAKKAPAMDVDKHCSARKIPNKEKTPERIMKEPTKRRDSLASNVSQQSNISSERSSLPQQRPRRWHGSKETVASISNHRNNFHQKSNSTRGKNDEGPTSSNASRHSTNSTNSLNKHKTFPSKGRSFSEGLNLSQQPEETARKNSDSESEVLNLIYADGKYVISEEEHGDNKIIDLLAKLGVLEKH